MKRIFAAIILCLLCLSVNAWGANCGGATPCACGDTVTSSYTLSDNMSCTNTGYGLTIGGNSVTLNLNGKAIIGDGNHTTTGIYSTARTGLTVYGGTVRNYKNQDIKVEGGSHVTITGMSLGSVIGTNPLGDGIYIGPSGGTPTDNVTISSSTFAGSYGRGALVLTGCDTCTISSNTFTSAAVGINYVVDLEPNASGIVRSVSIHDNTWNFSLSGVYSLWSTGGASGSTVDGLNIYNNIFTLNSVSSAITLGFKSATHATNVYGNTITNSVGDSILVNGVSGMTAYVYQNSIIATTGVNFNFGSTGIVYAYSNILTGGNTGLYCSPTTTCYGYGNTFYNYTTRGIDNYGTGEFKNNILSTTDATVVNVNEETGGTATYNYNLYYSPNDTSAIFSYHGTGRNDFATWKTLSGMDANSINADPLFTNSTTGDFSLTSGSPCCGVNLGSTYRMTINGRDRNAWGRGWSLGAYPLAGPPASYNQCNIR